MCSAEVKNAWSYTSIPLYIFMAWYLSNHRENFTFTYATWHSKTEYGEFNLCNKGVFIPT
jgi:hypothetical protein